MTRICCFAYFLFLFHSGLLSAQTSLSAYDLTQADKSFYLQRELKEISGLTYDPTLRQILAVNDELGKVYYINPENGKIVTSFVFGGKGDYEGIELVGNDIYVINNSGDLFLSSHSAQSKKIILPFAKRNDIEGLAYESSSKKLLIACKGWMKLGSSDFDIRKKAIYTYDIEKKRLDEKPFLLIDIEALVQFHTGLFKDSAKKSKKLSSSQKRLKSFSPSALAMHPLTGELYVLSSGAQCLIVFDKDLRLKDIQLLDKKSHRQPEGICFDEFCNLYISNEAKNKIAMLHIYRPKY